VIVLSRRNLLVNSGFSSYKERPGLEGALMGSVVMGCSVVRGDLGWIYID